MILDLINAAAGIAYIVALTVGLYRSRRGALRDADHAIAAFMLAALAALISAVAALMRVDVHGWVPVGLAGFFLAGAVLVVFLAVGRADRMEDAR